MLPSLLLACGGPSASDGLADDTPSSETTEADETTPLAPGVLSVSVDALDFGALARGCSVTAEVVVENTGEQPLEIEAITVTGDGASAVSIAEFEDDIDGGQSVTVSLTFTPAALYDYSLPLVITTDAGDAEVALSGSGVEGVAVTDTMTSGDNPAVDVLLVANHSTTMETFLPDLNAAMLTFWDELISTGTSASLGLITMDMEDPEHSGRIQQLLTEKDGAPVLPDATSTAPDDGLEAMLAALQEPLSSSDNIGFRRDGAPLSVVVVTVKDDDSKAHEEAGALLEEEDATLHLVGNFGNSCTTEWSIGYDSLAHSSGGLTIDACSETLASDMVDIARAILGHSDTFRLTAVPESAGDITVTLEGEDVPSSFTDGWTLDVIDNTITLRGAHVPEYRDTLTVSYVTAECL